MNEDNKVIHLRDYIEDNQKLTTSVLGSTPTHPHSNINARMMAFGVDLLTVVFINSSIHAAYATFINQYLYPLQNASKNAFLSGNITIQLTTFLLIFTSYFLFTTIVLNGKTFGKQLFKLTIIDENFVINHLENSHQITFRQSFHRTLGYLLCYLSAGTFFIFNFASEDNRGLSDYLSGTRTVDDKWLNYMLEHKEFSAEEVSINIRSLKKSA